MIFPSLSDAERAVLEDLLLHGPNRNLPTPIRGRLGLYKLIDETPEGWKITDAGRQALLAPPRPGAPRPRPPRDAEETPATRNYGKKTRDTSWFS